MRAFVVLLLYVGVARADGIVAGASVGAGAQGDGAYNAIEAGFDAEWGDARVGIGGRAVWIDGEWRDRDFAEARDAVRAIRLVQWHAGPFALAGGGLAPAQLAHVADGHRAALDDRPRTGARAQVIGERVSIGAEIDDVLDPSLAGGAFAWSFSRDWRVHAATAIDPLVELAAIELAVGRRWSGEGSMAEVGGGFVGEPELGASAIVFADFVVERIGARWFASTEARGGSGSVGAAFGPLHRLERTLHEGTRGIGGAIALGVAAPFGWARASVRARHELGTLVAASVGAPMGRRLQASAWVAATKRATAGAGELRYAWTRRYASVIEIARMYDTDAMEPTPTWSATAWFGITTD
jgi:hypothetical protein